jgi:hypothetical protein
MAGALTISTLNNDTGVLATQNGMTGIAKAWVNYNGVAQTIAGSFNVSSVTYNSTTNYTVNFTTAMPNTTYAPVFGGSWGSGLTSYIAVFDYSSARTTTALNLLVVDVNGAQTNSPSNNIVVFSS